MKFMKNWRDITFGFVCRGGGGVLFSEFYGLNLIYLCNLTTEFKKLKLYKCILNKYYNTCNGITLV